MPYGLQNGRELIIFFCRHNHAYNFHMEVNSSMWNESVPSVYQKKHQVLHDEDEKCDNDDIDDDDATKAEQRHVFRVWVLPTINNRGVTWPRQ